MDRDIGGIVGETLRSRYRGLFRDLQGTITIPPATGRVVPSDPERISLTIVNLGSFFVHVAPSGLVSANFGIRLDPQGGSMTTNLDEDGPLPTLEWFFFTTAAAGALYWLQSKRDVKVDDEVVIGTFEDLLPDENT